MIIANAEYVDVNYYVSSNSDYEELSFNHLNAQCTNHDKLLGLSNRMIDLARAKNEITSELNSLMREYQKSFNIKISDYTKYPLSYFYFICHNDEAFFKLLPDFFGRNPDLALSFIFNSIHSHITFSIPLKVKVFTPEQVSKIFRYATSEVIKYKDLCALYIQQFSLEFRTYADITDSIVQRFLQQITHLYKNMLIDDFRLSRVKMLSFFAMSYPFLTAEDINKMLPTISQNNLLLREFIQKLDSLNLEGLDLQYLDKIKSKYILNSLAYN